MTKKVKLTLENLVAKKLERDRSIVKVKEIDVPSLGGTLLFNKPADEDIFDAFERLKGADEDLRILDEVFTKLIYRCCPTLQDKELKEQLEVKDHLSIVPAIFELSDRMAIGKELLEMSGLSGEESSTEIKK